LRLQKYVMTIEKILRSRQSNAQGAARGLHSPPFPGVGLPRFPIFLDFLGNLERWFARPAHGFKPAADIHLGVSFATEMPGSRAASGSHIPLDDRELLISALNHIPMDRILTDDPANLALEFLQTRHALSVERWLGKNWLGKN